jgi:hypothetical protein
METGYPGAAAAPAIVAQESALPRIVVLRFTPDVGDVGLFVALVTVAFFVGWFFIRPPGR